MIKELHVANESCVAIANELGSLTNQTPHKAIRDLIIGWGKREIRRIKGVRARKISIAAKNAGKLIKPSNCESCSEITSKLNMHHDDYDKPLDVNWLCDVCHSKRQAEITLAEWVDFEDDIE